MSFLPCGAAAWGFRELDIERQLQQCKKAGYSALELGIANAPKDLPENASDEEMDRITALYRNYGIRLWAAATGDDLSSGDLDMIKVQQSKLFRVLDECHKMNIQVLRIFAGFTPLPDMTEKKWDLMTEAIREVSGYARSAGVFLAIETHGAVKNFDDGVIHTDTVTTDIPSLERLCGSIPDDVFFLLDPANLCAAGHSDILPYFELLTGRIIYFHLKNFSRTGSGHLLPSAVGTGILDWQNILEAVSQTQKPCYVEYELPDSIEEGILQSINTLRKWEELSNE